MVNDKYQDIFEQFKIYNQDLLDRVDEWESMGKNSIKVFLNNGDVYQFNSIMKTRRWINPEDSDDMTEMIFRKRFANNLAMFMYENGYTQETFCEEIGLSRMSLHKYLNKKATPSGYILTKIANLFGCTVDDLIEQ